MGDPAPAQAGRLADPRRQAMTATALRGISRFAATRGIPARAEVLLDYDVIEAFCVAGLRGLASPTRGTHRSVLRRLAGPVHGGPGQRAAPVAGAKPPPPYSAAERAELAAVAADRGYKNFVTNYARTLVADPAAPRLSRSRRRSSFICGHLVDGAPLGELLAITAICQAESLARYARHVDGAPSKAALRAWDKTQQAR